MKPTIPVFIAGAKSLENERNASIAAITEMNQETGSDVYWKATIFKDFDIALADKEKGQQENYNSFIRNKAYVCIFIIDGNVGTVTKEEFDVAWASFKEIGRPYILVLASHMQQSNHLAKEMENTLNSIGQYYTEYLGCEDLKNKLYIQLNKYAKDYPLIKFAKEDFKESVKGFNALVDNMKKSEIQPDSKEFTTSLQNLISATSIRNETTLSIILSNCLLGFTKAAENEKREFLLLSHAGIILCYYHLGEIDALVEEKEKLSQLKYEKTFWDRNGESIMGFVHVAISVGTMFSGRGSTGAGMLKSFPATQQYERDKVASRIAHFDELKKNLIQFIDDVVLKKNQIEVSSTN